ncbi:phosphotransferase [Hydrogenophaga sp. BPS33]|uniref:phosphotransferase n=1 Tax=Hydrogenophaga sp. BPS33 TaxID=2651974 RepID=UPI0013201608|nr:phosphotransferase [Hydrogenophaga sp. BPS33]QHE87435.1 phosphotransferase [Hydrogenophaga sp. BPS33]
MDASTQTRPAAVQQDIDAAALERYLSDRIVGFQGPLRVERFSGGQSNPTYLLVTDGARYVMRTKPAPAAMLLPSAHAIEREYRVMEALAGTDVPVAAVHLLCEDESVIGRAFYVMAFVEGRVLWDQSLAGMAPEERSAIYDEMHRVIAALHRVDPAAIGLADYGRPGNYFERQIARWTRQYQTSAMAPIREMDALIAWLPKNIPPSAREHTRPAIVHGDYRLDNLMFHPTEPRVLAVLDWELSTLGHPLADFSYLCMYWHIPHRTERGIGGLDLAALGIPDEADYLRRYGERTGRTDVQAVAADWNFYLAYNLFRLAAILQGVARRAEDGVAANAQAREAGALARPLAELAWTFAARHHPPALPIGA